MQSPYLGLLDLPACCAIVLQYCALMTSINSASIHVEEGLSEAAGPKTSFETCQPKAWRQTTSACWYDRVHMSEPESVVCNRNVFEPA